MADLFSKSIAEVTYQDLVEFAHTTPTENERLDWKEELTTARVTETIVAMVNTGGGLILIGVGEEEHSGTKRMIWPPRHGVKATAQDALMSMCRTSYRPPDYLPLYNLVEIPHLQDRYVLVVRVDQRLAPAYLWHLERGFLSRVGDQNRPATPEVIDALLHPKHQEEQRRLYDQWGMFASGSDGIVQQLIAVMRYPRGANLFGTEQKSALHRAVTAHFRRNYDPTMVPKYDSVSFESVLGQPDEKFSVQFSAAGVARMGISRRWTPTIPWRWIVGETVLVLECLQCDETSSVYQNVKEGDLRLVLANWPDGGVDADGLSLQAPTRGELMRGHTVVREHLVDPTTDRWHTVRAFLEHALADTGYLGYEGRLDDVIPNLAIWIAAYRSARP